MGRLSMLGCGGPIAAALPLDSLSATGAWSVRKLRTAYSGSAMRVRRSSDNAEQDIGFASNNLDTPALLSFAGAGDAFVVKWCDQSGHGRDLPQTTSSQQPKIVSSGSLVSGPGAKPALDFDGSNDVLQTAIAISNLISASSYSGSCVFNADSTPNTGSAALFGPFLFAGGANRYFAYSAWNGTAALYNWDGSNDTLGVAISTGTHYLGRVRHESGTLYNRINNGPEQSLASGNTSVLSDPFQVGGGSTMFDGRISEIIINSAVWTSGEEAGLAADTNAYFGLW